MAYGIATDNPFALLGGDEENDDPQKIQVPQESVAPPKSDQPPKGGQFGQGARGRGGRGGRNDRGGRGGRLGGRSGRGRGGYESRGYYDSGEQGYDGDVPPVSRGGGRLGGRGGRGRGGGDGGGFRKRDYDRRDQSGRGHEFDKRGGIGKGNWGGPTDSWEDPPAEDAPPATEQNGAAPAEGDPADGEVKEGAAGEVVEKEEEREAPKFTLAEYEEMMKDKFLTKTVQKFEVDMTQFEGMAELKKTSVETGFEGLEIEKTTKTKLKPRKESISVETGFRVGDPVRRGRGRGPGRGRSRDFEREGSGRFDNPDGGDAGNSGWGASGSGGSGNYRGGGGARRGDRRSGSYGGSYGGSGNYGGYGGSSQPKQPDMADQTSFPSLS